MTLREETETALKRFTLVEPVTIEDMDTIAKHLRFALGGDAKVEVFRLKSTEPVFVVAWRDGATARVMITPFSTSAEATKAPGI